MNVPKVKVCGITNLEDACCCLEAGADYLGFIFFENSPRFIHPEKAAEIVRELKKNYGFKSTAVFVNADKSFILDLCAFIAPDFVQLHGDENEDFIMDIRKTLHSGTGIIKSFRVNPDFDCSTCLHYAADYFLFDTFSRKSYGGTGSVFNWKLVSDFPLRDRMFLSGGINSINLADAVLNIRPFAVDVSSSLEKYPGKKDKEKVTAFFNVLQQIKKPEIF